MNTIEFAEGLINLDRVDYVRPSHIIFHGTYGQEIEINTAKTTFVFSNECELTVNKPYQTVVTMLARR
jgi:hypothetical protein